MSSFADEECGELSQGASVVLQGVMAVGWSKVLRRRIVAEREARRSSRQRVLRMCEMNARRSLVLSGAWVYVKRGSLPVFKKKAPAMIRGSALLPIHVIASGSESEDEPLIRRVVKTQGFVASTFNGSDSEQGSSESERSVMARKEFVDESEGGSETESSDSESESSESGSESESDGDVMGNEEFHIDRAS
jgi:hypothetical protein